MIEIIKWSNKDDILLIKNKQHMNLDTLSVQF